MAATIYYTLTGKLLPSAVERLDKDTLSWEEPELRALSPAALRTLRKALNVQSGDRLQSMEELENGLFAQEKPKEAKQSLGMQWIVPVATLLCVLGIVGGIVWLTNKEEASDPQSSSVPVETAADVSSNDTAPLVAGRNFRSKDGNYDLLFGETGDCHLISFTGSQQNGTYTQDGSKIRILLAGGKFRMQAVQKGQDLQVSCSLFSELLFQEIA